MSTKLGFTTIMRRKNLIKEFFYDTFWSLASYPRMVLEIVIRKNFGERYFSLATAITVLIILLAIPFGTQLAGSILSKYIFGIRDNTSILSILLHYATWYVYTIWFGYQACLRWLEIHRRPSIFEVPYFTKSAGSIHPLFFQIKIFGKYLTVRQIEIFGEPALFFLSGILLMLIGQRLGALFIVSSILYGLSYASAYKEGDDFGMDHLDKIILSKDLEEFMTQREKYIASRGVRWRMTTPTSQELRDETLGEMLKAFGDTGPTLAI